MQRLIRGNSPRLRRPCRGSCRSSHTSSRASPHHRSSTDAPALLLRASDCNVGTCRQQPLRLHNSSVRHLHPRVLFRRTGNRMSLRARSTCRLPCSLAHRWCSHCHARCRISMNLLDHSNRWGQVLGLRVPTAVGPAPQRPSLLQSLLPPGRGYLPIWGVIRPSRHQFGLRNLAVSDRGPIAVIRRSPLNRPRLARVLTSTPPTPKLGFAITNPRPPRPPPPEAQPCPPPPPSCPPPCPDQAPARARPLQPRGFRRERGQ